MRQITEQGITDSECDHSAEQSGLASNLENRLTNLLHALFLTKMENDASDDADSQPHEYSVSCDGPGSIHSLNIVPTSENVNG